MRRILSTFLLLAADSLLGSLLLRSQGRSVWQRFNEALTEGRMPHREVLDGVLIIFGGAFLITPGFITDVVGLVLLVPIIQQPVKVGSSSRTMASRGSPSSDSVSGMKP